MSDLIPQLIAYIVAVSSTFSADLGYNAQLFEPWDSSLIRIEYKTQTQLNQIYYNGVDPENGMNALGLQIGLTVYLNKDWSPDSVKDQSILLHELVHVLQEETGIDYKCPGDRERLAYYIQEKWLLEEQGWTQQKFYEDIIPTLAMVALMTCHNPNLARAWEAGP